MPSSDSSRDVLLDLGGEVGVAGVIEGFGKALGQADALVELPDGQQPGVAGQLARRWLDDEWGAEEVQDL